MMLECNYAQSNIFSCTDKKEVFLSCCSLGSASTTRNHQVRRRKRKSRRFSCSCWVLVHKRRTWLRPNFLCKQTGIRQTNFMSWLGMTCIDIFYVFDLFIDSRLLVLLCIQRPYNLLTLQTHSVIRKYSPLILFLTSKGSRRAHDDACYMFMDSWISSDRKNAIRPNSTWRPKLNPNIVNNM